MGLEMARARYQEHSLKATSDDSILTSRKQFMGAHEWREVSDSLGYTVNDVRRIWYGSLDARGCRGNAGDVEYPERLFEMLVYAIQDGHSQELHRYNMDTLRGMLFIDNVSSMGIKEEYAARFNDVKNGAIVVPIMASGIICGAKAFAQLQGMGKSPEYVLMSYSHFRNPYKHTNSHGDEYCEIEDAIYVHSQSLNFLKENTHRQIVLADDIESTGMTIRVIVNALSGLGFHDISVTSSYNIGTFEPSLLVRKEPTNLPDDNRPIRTILKQELKGERRD